MSQGVAAMAVVLHQHVCERATVSVWAHGLLFLLMEQISLKPLVVHFN